MRALLCALLAAAALLVGSRPVLGADEIACGRIVEFIAPSATVIGSFVIVRPGDPAPRGYAVVIPAGTDLTPTTATWVCLRTTEIQPTQLASGSTTTRAFQSLVPPGAPGYVAEPAAEIACGRLISLEPATATARGGLTIDQSQPPPAPRPAPSAGTVVPPGISFSLTAGTQLTYADVQGYICVRFTSAISPRTFLGLVAPGSSGYLPEPITASPSPGASSATRPSGLGGTGALPNTSTDPSGAGAAGIAAVAALLMLLAAAGTRSRSTARR